MGPIENAEMIHVCKNMSSGMPDLGAVLWFLFGIRYFSQAKIWGQRIRQRGRTEFSLTLLGPSSPS